MSGGFIKELDALTEQFQRLADDEVDKIIDWTFNSLSHKVLARIRAVWPIKTKLSWNTWHFEKRGPMDYWLVNDAKSPWGERIEYVPVVYAKGDGSKTPIVDGIVETAIADTVPDVEPEFIKRLERYLK